MSAKLTIRIPHIDWRAGSIEAGRPFFKPGQRLRRLGFRGQPLRHPDGRWFTPDEAAAFAGKVEAEAASREAAAAGGKRLKAPPRLPGASLVSFGELIVAGLEQMKQDGQVRGRQQKKAPGAATVRWYEKLAMVLMQDAPDVWAAPAAALTPAAFEGVIDVIWQKRGLATVRGVRALVSRTWNRQGRRHGLRNPAGGARLPMLRTTVRFGSYAEMMHLVATADAMGRPEIGDSIMLGLFTCQRQNDRLALAGGQVVSDGAELLFRQSKTGKSLLVPAVGLLRQRLAAAAERRKAMKVAWPNVVINEARQQPFTADEYARVFRQVKDEAASTLPSLADFLDKHLRPSGITWLALAGCDAIRIRSISGHSLATIQQMLDRHYLGHDTAMAREAINTLEAWVGQQG